MTGFAQDRSDRPPAHDRRWMTTPSSADAEASRPRCVHGDAFVKHPRRRPDLNSAVGHSHPYARSHHASSSAVAHQDCARASPGQRVAYSPNATRHTSPKIDLIGLEIRGHRRHERGRQRRRLEHVRGDQLAEARAAERRPPGHHLEQRPPAYDRRWRSSADAEASTRRHRDDDACIGDAFVRSSTPNGLACSIPPPITAIPMRDPHARSQCAIQ